MSLRVADSGLQYATNDTRTRFDPVRGAERSGPWGHGPKSKAGRPSQSRWCYTAAMRFYHVDFPFCVPDSWWLKAKMAEFEPRTLHYRTDDPSALSVSVGEVEPVRRQLSYGVFADEEGVLKILCGFVENSAIPPVDIKRQPRDSVYPYALWNGAHRFYCSVAAGFSHVPAVVTGELEAAQANLRFLRGDLD